MSSWRRTALPAGTEIMVGYAEATAAASAEALPASACRSAVERAAATVDAAGA
jgi:hypothetical protein